MNDQSGVQIGTMVWMSHKNSFEKRLCGGISHIWSVILPDSSEIMRCSLYWNL